MIFTCTLDYPFTLHVELFLYKTEAEILHRNPFGFCFLLSFPICYQISLLRISDIILYLERLFYPCVSQIKNICETIFICTLDCPFRLDSVCPFVSGSQIGFVLTIYEKGTIEYIYKELPLMIFNCQTKNSLIFLNLNLAKQLSDFLNEIWFSLHQMNSSLNSYSLFSNLSEFNFRFFHFINQTVGSHPINPFLLSPEAVSNNSVGRKAVRFICHWNQSFLFWIGTLFVPDMMFFSLS